MERFGKSADTMRAPQVFIETFGCQMNEYDTELVRSILKARGYGFTDSADSADVVLLNTCAIRENAHNKVYGHLGLLKPLKEERGLVIGVLGCMAQNLKRDLLAGDTLIDVLVGPDSYRALPDLLEQAAAGRKGVAVDLSEYETTPISSLIASRASPPGSPSCAAATTSAPSAWSRTPAAASAAATSSASCGKPKPSPPAGASR